MKLNYFIVAQAFTFTGCSSDRLAVASKHQVSVFEKEEDAAYEGSLNREPVNPVATLLKGEEVLVLKDTYGKDYWACKVKLKSNKSGWALCTNLSFQGGG
ncbi:hypothetical protein [Neptuniibacter sp. QD48_11]|uniref:hypothetical protein n=1 Tax=Neptuniibacter sp. QD48_11 TaxID=3398211 RepID=UPI0039F60932